MTSWFFEFYLQNEYWFACVQLALAMFGMGATLKPVDFVAIFKELKAFTTGLGIQVILVPLFAFVFIQIVELHPGVLIGLALCAAIPGGSISNVLTYVAKGDVPLSLAMTSVTSFACLFSTPYVLSFLLAGFFTLNDFEMPVARIAWEIYSSVIVPLILGMLFLKMLPQKAALFSKWSIRVSVMTILFIAIGSLGAGRIDVASFGFENGIYVVLFIIGLLVLSFVGAALANLKTPEVTAISVEVSVRSVNIAILLKTIIFPAAANDPVGNMVMFTILFYGGTQLVCAIPLLAFCFRLSKSSFSRPIEIAAVHLPRLRKPKPMVS